MAAQHPGQHAPFEVAIGYHPIVDHRFVHPGRAHWVDDRGIYQSAWGLENPTEVRAAHLGVPHGIQLGAESATSSGPVLTADEPWERLVWWPKVIRDGGVYRMWYEAVPPDHWDPAKAPSLGNPVFAGLLCYAESDDGFTWRKPKLGLGEWEGSTETNIVLGRDLVGSMGMHGVSVFIDPSAPSQDRYKAFWYGNVEAATVARLARERPGEVEAGSQRSSHGRAMYVATSPDGLRWEVEPEPAAIFPSDTLQVVEWDAPREAYVWFGRGWSWGRRTIARAESRDFRRWPTPVDVLTEAPHHTPHTDLYTNGKTHYPGDPTTHLMFPTLYDRATDGTSFGVAASADGGAWTWIPGAPALGTGAPGAFDAGSMFAGIGLHELPGERVGFPYGAYTQPHKYPANLADSGLGWCLWERGRIAGLKAGEQGEFWTPPLTLRGGTLRLNVRTAIGGYVQVGVADESWAERDGFGLKDCTPIEGDQMEAPVVWGAGARTQFATDGPVILRFRLRHATLHGFEVVA